LIESEYVDIFRMSSMLNGPCEALANCHGLSQQDQIYPLLLASAKECCFAQSFCNLLSGVCRSHFHLANSVSVRRFAIDLAREVSFAGAVADEGWTTSCNLPLGEAIRDTLSGTDVFEVLGCLSHLAGFYNSAVATHLSRAFINTVINRLRLQSETRKLN
jgi:hypothetical protein